MLSTEISLSNLLLSERSSFKTVPDSGIGLKLRPVRSSIHKAERTTTSNDNLKLRKDPLFLRAFYFGHAMYMAIKTFTVPKVNKHFDINRFLKWFP